LGALSGAPRFVAHFVGTHEQRILKWPMVDLEPPALTRGRLLRFRGLDE